LNVELVGAFLEQLEGGKVQLAESMSEDKRRIQGGVNIALMQIGAGGERLTGYKETKTIYYDLYKRLENTLRTEGKLVDLSALDKVEYEPKENQFVLAHGDVTFTPGWSAWKSFGYILSKLNEWLGQLQTLSQEQQIQAASPHTAPLESARSLVLPNNRPIILLASPTQIDILPALPEEPPEEIRPLIKPEEIKIALYVPERHCKFRGTALLKHFTEDRIAELIMGQETHKAFAMGLTSKLSAERVDFTPIAIFVII